ncbi:protein-ADP-ribose hydrolase [Ligilactobacillus animalis]|uniref:protein-ADP-ribose hydrolase n=1 Tax=Ligilactobacillus animalis TaxID=1605 RepID=UPI00259417A4|nr:protein-ADP-ribose hydrolase [Ligilactobacillus animalis]
MDQAKRRLYLIQSLLNENPRTAKFKIPKTQAEQEKMLRALFNTRLARPITPEFEQIQDAYLTEVLAQKKITTLKDLTPVADNIYLWQGDITTLKVDAIVNAANRMMLGCYRPNCNCIDNAIHTFAGIQLRSECFDLMKAQGHLEATGQAKITKAYNLPSKYVIHTVGPIVSGKLTEKHKALLASSYLSCLELAEQKNLDSIAFCCISTGEFHFPNEEAAKIAIRTVEEFLAKSQSKMKVVFNVFKESDKEIYEKFLIQSQ